MHWHVLDTGRRTANANMKIDLSLLNDLKLDNRPILHHYDWEGDCATFGYFLDPSHFLHMTGVKQKSLNLAQRPTGGGIIFHICDLAFSVVVPSSHPRYSINTLDNYALINNAVIDALRQLGDKRSVHFELLNEEPVPFDPNCQKFCMAKPTKFDVILGGKKIGGAAQRRTKLGFLHQGTISVAILPEAYLKEVLLPETCVLDAMKKNSISLIGENWTRHQLKNARMEVREALTRAIISI